MNRWFNKIYANIFGYFWMPCPICGEEFGGHETGDYGLNIQEDPNKGVSVCKSCANIANDVSTVYSILNRMVWTLHGDWYYYRSRSSLVEAAKKFSETSIYKDVIKRHGHIK